MSATPDAVVAGHICLDMIPGLSSLTERRWESYFQPGKLLEAGPLTLCTGGPVSNTGLALHKLGIETRLMGKVGDDLVGQAIQQLVRSFGPHLSDGMVVDRSVNSSYTVIISPPGVDRIFLHYPGANDTYGAEDVRYDVVATARLFHFGYPPVMKRMYADGGAELVEIFRRVKALGVTTSLDMALPDPCSVAGQANWSAILQAVMPHVDIFLPSIEEILYMLRRERYETLVQSAGGADILRLIVPSLLTDLSCELLEMGCRVVGFKMGDRGLYVHTAGQSTIEALGASRPSTPDVWAHKELWAPCFKVDVVGTTGCGDATIAGFLSALLRDMSLESAVTAAVAVGACNVEALDALSGLRPWHETWQRVHAGWARGDCVITDSGWHFDDHRHLWVGPG